MKLMKLVNWCYYGHRPDTHFDKVEWENLQKHTKDKTCYNLEKNHLTNKWENMKKESKLYNRLMRLDTGLGGIRSLIEAPPEWWEDKINERKEYAKFRNKNLIIFDEKYALLFRDSVAIGNQTMTSLQFQKIPIRTNKIWRKMEISKSSIYEEKVDALLDSISTKAHKHFHKIILP
uniref:Myb/SANT-like domain-containing protein n=1 Tax=Lactuca sativa TaxID=4236 RepID=A0A9R1UZM1_LACSA|nr:hypothetical protein LSAT_V11C700376300 [Lactuca sativa]